MEILTIWNPGRRPCIVLRLNGGLDCRETRGSLQSRARSSPPLCWAGRGPRAVVRTRRGFPTAGPPPPLRRRHSATTHKRAPILRTTPTRGPPTRRAKSRRGRRGRRSRRRLGWTSAGPSPHQTAARWQRKPRAARHAAANQRPVSTQVQGPRDERANWGTGPACRGGRRRDPLASASGDVKLSWPRGHVHGGWSSCCSLSPSSTAGARTSGTASGLAAAVALVLGPRGPRGSACTPARGARPEARHRHPTGRGEGARDGSVGAREDQVPTSRRLPGTPVVTTRPCVVS